MMSKADEMRTTAKQAREKEKAKWKELVASLIAACDPKEVDAEYERVMEIVAKRAMNGHNCAPICSDRTHSYRDYYAYLCHSNTVHGSLQNYNPYVIEAEVVKRLRADGFTVQNYILGGRAETHVSWEEGKDYEQRDV
jgi:hypothetical protein